MTAEASRSSAEEAKRESRETSHTSNGDEKHRTANEDEKHRTPNGDETHWTPNGDETHWTANGDKKHAEIVKKAGSATQLNFVDEAPHHDDDDDDDDNQLPTPPDGGWGWVVVFSSFIIHIIADGVAYSFGVFLVAFTHYFPDVGRGQLGWIGSLMVGVTLGSGMAIFILILPVR